MSTSGLIASIRQDLLSSLRTMRKRPGFSLAVVLIVALGIAANTAMFSVIHAVLLKPLAYAEPDRVVVITGGTLVFFQQLLPSVRSYTAIGAYAEGLE